MECAGMLVRFTCESWGGKGGYTYLGAERFLSAPSQGLPPDTLALQAQPNGVAARWRPASCAPSVRFLGLLEGG